jgi:LysR family transcriptional activator of nhaA
MVYEYADEMFSLGWELLGALRGMPGRRTGRLHVGIPTYFPKLITYRLLQPVINLPHELQLVCHEADMGTLTAGLARHRFDVILTDTPVHSPQVRALNHSLGEWGVAVCGIPSLAAQFRGRFPKSLDGAPFLLPSPAAEMRRALDAWFDSCSYSGAWLRSSMTAR